MLRCCASRWFAALVRITVDKRQRCPAPGPSSSWSPSKLRSVHVARRTLLRRLDAGSAVSTTRDYLTTRLLYALRQGSLALGASIGAGRWGDPGPERCLGHGPL